MRDFVECTVLLLFHVFLHIPQKQRTNVGKVTNMMTYRSTNVTGEVAKPRVGNAMAAMNVDMDTTCPPPPPPRSQSQVLRSAFQCAHCSHAEAASVTLRLFTTLRHHANTLTVVNNGSRKDN